ncbi:hypothetical protein RHOSPDRAFT_35282 [Rhodotorula sp. JG-1b]|nr:hypothetical protein RHOSPDRAFT_35282 [Rhodotorula sp. JG-1b]
MGATRQRTRGHETLRDRAARRNYNKIEFRGITGTFVVQLNDDERLTILDFNSLSTRFLNAIDIPDLKKRGQSYLLENVLSHDKWLVRHPLLITEDLARAAKPSMDGNKLVDVSDKILEKMDKALPDVYGESLLAYTYRRLVQIAREEEETKSIIFDDADFAFGPAQQQQQPRRSAKANKLVTRSAPPVPVAPDVTDADLEELKRQVRRALSVPASPTPEAGPSSSSRAAPPPAKKAKLGAPLAELSGENQSGRRRVSSHGTAYLDELWQHGSTSGGGGGGKKRTASPDLVLSSDSEGGNVDEGRTIRGMIILDSDEE